MLNATPWDRHAGIVESLGRPRSALVVGTRVHAVARAAVARGARVTVLEAGADAPTGEPYDLVVLDGVSHAEARARLGDAGRLLSDGGHLLLAADGRGAELAELVAAARQAGLDVLRSDVIPGSSGERPGDAGHEPPAAQPRSPHPTARLLGGVGRLVARAASGVVAGGEVLVVRKRPAKGPLSLTVGMLTLNESESVERMIDEIRAAAPDAKILLVDSSSDATPELARARGARVVRQLPARGHGPAMESLMYEAAGESDALIYIDCDFTYPIREIPRIRGMLEDGADVVNASRTSRYPRAMPLANFAANRVFAAAAALVHGLPTTDVHSGLRGYRSSVIRGFSFDGEGDALPLDTLILPARSGYRIVEFPIDYAERVGVSKLAKLRGTVWTFRRIASAIGKGRRVARDGRYEVRRAT